MSVLTREGLEGSPLADLHALASELGLDGFRRLRKADLVDALLERAGASDAPIGTTDDPEADTEGTAVDADVDPAETGTGRRRGRRGGRGRKRAAEEDGATDEDAASDAPAERDRGDVLAQDDAPEEVAAETEERDETPARDDRVAEGIVELLDNGSGFVRVNPPGPSDDDVYISAAQVRRCELVSGDRVTGPVRRPRRSERFPSLVRVDTINGAPAEEVAEGTPYDELPAAWPTERFALGSDDPTLTAIEWLTPIGRGSRVTIAGASGAGKTEALRLLAGALAGDEGLELTVVLVGARPEELHAWGDGPVQPAAALSFAAGPEAQAQALERAVETAKRLAARGGHAVLLVDTLDAVPAPVARRALAAARNLVDGGSLTVVATASAPLGGETTTIALDPLLASTRRFPALDLPRSTTFRAELLVGDAGADAIAQARAQALDA